MVEEEKVEEEKEVEEKEDKLFKKNLDQKENLRKKQNRQMMIAVSLMIIVIIIALGIPLFIQTFINKFTYINLHFQKSITGNLVLYSADVPVIDNEGEIVSSYFVNFRNNPKELQEVEMDDRIKEGGVKFIENQIVYISLNPDMEKCSDNTLAMFILGGFLKDAELDVKSAFSDKEKAEEAGIPYKDCKDSTSNTVIKVTSGEETRINQMSSNCYEIVYADCEIVKGVERFNLAILEEYMGHFAKKSDFGL